ncbi:MAG: lytic murein transglycosylase [Myxococcota bacterium]|nr:lytic murein transglycosylase [Myxococcota bacterium]
MQNRQRRNRAPLQAFAWTAIAALATGLLVVSAGPAPASRADGDFEAWLRQVEADALERGISRATVRTALTDLEPIPEIVELDRSQPRKPAEFCSYMKRRLTKTRIARAKRVMVEHRGLLRELNAAYGVPERYLVALWGLETNFGDYMGDYPVVGALATLGHDPRRGDMFREQLISALQILDEGHQAHDSMKGSWAGAMGQVQFMPSTFLAYAVDHDGDGRKDLWQSTPDALASAANYLSQAGWRSGETWGRQVSLPEELDGATRVLRHKRALSDWQARGVRRIDGGDLPESNLRASIVQPRRSKGGPAFLAYPNYHAFLEWNRSTFFAVSVGTMADAVTGVARFRSCGG